MQWCCCSLTYSSAAVKLNDDGAKNMSQVGTKAAYQVAGRMHDFNG
jgi:hypothetical protein